VLPQALKGQRSRGGAAKQDDIGLAGRVADRDIRLHLIVSLQEFPQ
jgi:hypothetical protein